MTGSQQVQMEVADRQAHSDVVDVRLYSCCFLKKCGEIEIISIFLKHFNKNGTKYFQVNVRGQLYISLEFLDMKKCGNYWFEQH